MSAFSREIALLADLERAGAITATSIDLPEGTSLDRLEALFSYFGSVGSAIRWYVGDLIVWGEGCYGDRVYAAAEATRLSPGTLQNYASVAGRVAPDRRRAELAFSHHQEVAYLEPSVQAHWLDRAVENGWTKKELRELLRDEGVIDSKPGPQWSRLDSAASGGPAAGAAPALPPGPPTPYPAVLAQLRDRLDDNIEREALSWALSQLAPELA